jgi:Na+/proline symporter
MGLQAADWLIIILFLVFSLIIGLIFRKRASANLESFFLGGRNMPWFIAGISMVATTFAADTPLAVTELVGKNGIAGNWLWWSFLAGGMLTTFFFAKLWRRAGVLTEIELIELRYSGKPARILRGFKAIYLGLIMNILIIGWVNLAMITILQEFFGMEIGTVYIVLSGLMVFAAVYTSLSGLWGVAVTDLVQFTIAIAGTIILAIIVVNTESVGGISGLQAQLPASTFNFFPTLSDGDGLQTLSLSIGAFLAYAGVQWWASWYPGQEPGGGGYVAQRMMSTKTEKGAVYATLLFQVAHFCLRPWPWILVALSCLVLYPDISPINNPEIEEGVFGKGYVRAMKDFLPTGLKGLLLAAFLGAYLSTISTQLNWGAGYIVNDFYKRFLSSGRSDKHYVFSSRIATVILMALGLLVTTQMKSVSGVWAFVMECGAGLGLVLILRWYWWRINAWAEITATIAPFLGYSISKFYLGLEFPESFFVTVGFTTISWIVIMFLTKPENKEGLQKFFDKVRPDGNWKPFRQKNATNRSSILSLLAAWIASVIMAYCVLFGTGKIIFGEYLAAAYFLGISALALGILIFVLKRTNIWQ